MLRGGLRSEDKNGTKFTRKLKMVHVIVAIMLPILGYIIAKTSETAVFRYEVNTHLETHTVEKEAANVRTIIEKEYLPVIMTKLDEISKDIKDLK